MKSQQRRFHVKVAHDKSWPGRSLESTLNRNDARTNRLKAPIFKVLKSRQVAGSSKICLLLSFNLVTQTTNLRTEGRLYYR